MPRRSRSTTTTVLALALGALRPSVARAEDVATPKPPAAPTPTPAARAVPAPTPTQAADAALAAVQAKDVAALRALAATDRPDPWLVADELIGRGEIAAAAEFAVAAPRTDVAALPAYVTARRGKPDDPARRARLGAADAALRTGTAEDAITALGAEEPAPLDDVVGIQLAMSRGGALASLGRLEAATAAFQAAGEAAERLGWLARAARAFYAAGGSAFSRSAIPAARSAWDRGLSVCERLGDEAGAARMLAGIGILCDVLGNYAQALATDERALAIQEALGDKAGAATTLGNIGLVYYGLGDYAQALATQQRALAAQEALGDRAGVARTLGNVGNIHASLGEYAKALSTYERALAAKDALGDRSGAARTLGNIGNVYDVLGDHAKALSAHQRALATQEALGDKAGAATTLGNIGLVQHALGDYASAVETHARALAAKEALGDKAGAARTLANIGLAYDALGDRARALETHQRALVAQEALGDRAAAATTLGNIGVVYDALGDHAQALATHQRALAAQEALGDRAGAARTLGNIGHVYDVLGDRANAMAFARRAASALASVVSGLGTEEGAGARAPLAFVYDVGARAAVAAGDASELAYFLESGRAGALLEGLEARQALWTIAVPPALRAEEGQARAAETVATRALQRASEAGDLAVLRACRADLDRARERTSAVVARIQREAKAGAALVYREAATLDEIRATLAEGDVLVLYGMLEKAACALVVTPGEARIVVLAARATLEEAIGELALDAPQADPGAALAALERLVVAPLRLPAGTRRLLISPTGALGLVPFAALAPDVTVAYVPSGTTYRMLREDRSPRGEGVLALGDPDYAARPDAHASPALHGGLRLAPLPGTREEVLALGTHVLLGAEATEAGFREAVARRPRWRAVHFACHGLFDPERWARSSLALTPAGDDDGFLTALDVFRTKIPADLAVLSACETGKGKLVNGEGLVGLTRAFMFAGAPRVIVSLWKVDDDASRALMVKFYELWNPKDGQPGRPTAEALREAQAFVRDHPAHPEWKHPYYWAAWVLWGLAS